MPDGVVPAGGAKDPLFGYIERFATVLMAAGFPPMPARVFVALLITDSGRLTAAELADLVLLLHGALVEGTLAEAGLGGAPVSHASDPALVRGAEGASA